MIKSYIEIVWNSVKIVGDDEQVRDSWVKLVARRKGTTVNSDTFLCADSSWVKNLTTLSKVPVFTKFNGEWFFGAKSFFKCAKEQAIDGKIPKEDFESILSDYRNTNESEFSEIVSLLEGNNYRFSIDFLLRMYKQSLASKQFAIPFGRMLFNRKDCPKDIFEDDEIKNNPVHIENMRHWKKAVEFLKIYGMKMQDLDKGV